MVSISIVTCCKNTWMSGSLAIWRRLVPLGSTRWKCKCLVILYPKRQFIEPCCYLSRTHFVWKEVRDVIHRLYRDIQRTICAFKYIVLVYKRNVHSYPVFMRSPNTLTGLSGRASTNGLSVTALLPDKSAILRICLYLLLMLGICYFFPVLSQLTSLTP